MLNGAAPSLDLDATGAALAAARFVVATGLVSAVGTLGFLCFVAPGGNAGATPDRRSLGLARASLAAALAGLLGWPVLDAVSLAHPAGGPDAVVRGAFDALTTVLWRTRFGHLVAAQAAATLAAMLALRRSHRAAAGLAGLALLLHAGHGHAMAMGSGPRLLLGSEIVHLAAAAAWLGALPPLLLHVAATPPDLGLLACRRFSRIGRVAVVALAGTALAQAWSLAGGVPGLIGTAYGWVLLLKSALLATLTGFALANRYRIAPLLAGADPARGRRVLVRSIAVQTGFGLAALAAAATLSMLPPGMHAEPVWPFRVQPSLVVVRAEPAFRSEVADAVLALLGALLLVALGMAARRVRWLAWGTAAAIAWFAVPHFDLLFVEAYPTSFYRSPTGFAATSIAAGAALYPQLCAGCHGADGRGDGPAAQRLAIPPADLTAEHLWAHPDGVLFWWLSHGIVSAEGEVAMPGFGGALSDEQIWSLIDYVRARNAGMNRPGAGSFTPAIAAPAFEANCPDVGPITLDGLRGRVVRLAAVGSSLPPPVAGAFTVFIAPNVERAASGCVATDPAVAAAYSIVGGVEPGELPGTQFLVDANGWLRRILPPGQAAGIGAEVGLVARAPLPVGGETHKHDE